jgi:hypothetical protein
MCYKRRHVYLGQIFKNPLQVRPTTLKTDISSMPAKSSILFGSIAVAYKGKEFNPK